MSRVGKIISYNSETGRGDLVDNRYHDRIYKFVATGYIAGQYVIYETTDLNPITGHQECSLVAPKLWRGVQDLDDFNELPSKEEINKFFT